MFKYIAITFLYISSSYALECPSGLKVKDIALDMMRAELSGLQAPGMKNHSCLKQEKFPFLLVEHDASNEVVKDIEGFVEDLKNVKVSRVQTVDPKVHSYKAEYEIQYVDIKDGKKKTHKDSISFFLYKDNPNQSIYGCGGVLQRPDKLLLFKKCQ